MYVIVSPAFTSVPAVGFACFQNFKSDLFTMLFTGPTSSLFTVAVFVNVFTRASSSNGFTVTSKLKVVCPKAVTSTSIPAFKLSSVY